MTDEDAKSGRFLGYQWRLTHQPTVWRFSIREILLATAAVAGLLAAVIANRQSPEYFTPSQLFDSLDIRVVLVDLNHPEARRRAGPIRGRRGAASYRRIDYELPLNSARADEALRELHFALRKEIEKAGASVVQDHGLDSSRSPLSPVEIQYQAGPRCGVIIIAPAEHFGDQLVLRTWIYEWPNRRR